MKEVLKMKVKGLVLLVLIFNIFCDSKITKCILQTNLYVLVSYISWKLEMLVES